MATVNGQDKSYQTKQFALRFLLSWLVPAVGIVIWQILSDRNVIPSRILPAPSQVIAAGKNLWNSGELPSAIQISSERAAWGFVFGGLAGFALGLFTGLFAVAEMLFDSSVQMLRNIPHLALIPLVIVWFGIEEPAKIFLVSLGVFFPIYINTYHGIRSIDPGLREMASVYGVRPWALFWNVILPGAMPSILLGVRYALGVMWLTLIVAETISSDSGIGYITMNAREFMQTDVVLLGILMYALLGKFADTSVRILERIMLRWQPIYQR